MTKQERALIRKAQKAAQQAVLKAGKYLRTSFTESNLITFDKLHEKIVADTKAEEIILATLTAQFQHPFSYISEETRSATTSTIEFVIDPLEGTSNFARGIPFFATQIAIFYQEKLVASCVYSPIKKDLYTAVRGEGAYKNDVPITVKKAIVPKLALASCGAGNAKADKKRLIAQLANLIDHIRSVRLYGASGLELAYVAAGELDCYLNIGSNLYDVAAGVLLVQEAGGVVSDLENQPWNRESKTLFAAPPQLLTALITKLS